MKTKFNTEQENNFRRVSKLSFIPFGILVALMSPSAFANDVTHKTASIEETFVVLQKPAITEETDTIITISTSYKKTIEDVIKEDNLIIDNSISNEVYPLDFNKILKSSAKRNTVKYQNRFSKNLSLQS